jgi:hypothetical protein
VNNIGSVPTPSLASVRVIWCGKVGIVGFYNENGSINNIDMTGAIPTGVDTRKHYSYDISGRINETCTTTSFLFLGFLTEICLEHEYNKLVSDSHLVAFTYLFRWMISAHINIKALNKEIEQLKKDK